MTMSVPIRSSLMWCCAFALMAISVGGCTRTGYRLDADREAYDVIDMANPLNVDPNPRGTNYGIEMDPRSRFYEPYDPDCPPMPQDDPASHTYMQIVNGTTGWRHWFDFGERFDIENPQWRERLAEYVEITEDGAVKLDVNSALRLAYVHSPSNQTQLETIYLTALDVSTERFRLDTQFFGGYDTNYVHNGSLAPAGLRFDPTTNRFVVGPAVDGVETNRLTVGRPFAGNPALQLQRRFATAGEILAGFANSFVFEFTGGDANLSASLLNFSLIQPLLRGAGKDIALEQLTQVERDMLANLRAYSQYRQGFYTQIAIGELGVAGPQRGGRGTSVQVFGGQGGVNGYIGLLQQLQVIRNTEDNLSLQLRTLEQLEAFLEIGVIDLVQVDQFRQSIENERSRLLTNQNQFEFALDSYKTSTLGLPPNLPVVLDDSLTQQFQFVSREATAITDTISDIQAKAGFLPDEPEIESITIVIDDLAALIEPVKIQFDAVRQDLDKMESEVSTRENQMDDEQRLAFAEERQRLRETMLDLEGKLIEAEASLEAIRLGLGPDTRKQTSRKVVVWIGNFLRIVQRSVLTQARARLESISVPLVDLDPEMALDIALSNRLDFMNARAALVDNWRSIQVSADALQSVLNLTASGNLRTARNNPLSFRAPTGDFRLGVEFDAPFTRLLERNDYRVEQINFQRSRRAYIQSVDSLHLDLRQVLRTIEQQRLNLEIQRRAVAIAIRRVDQTRAELNRPVPPPVPGQGAAQFGPTAAINLLSALSSLRDTQNSFLGAWLSYYAARMRLSRELGIMQLDQEGRWLDRPVNGQAEEIPLSEIQALEASLGFPSLMDEPNASVQGTMLDVEIDVPANSFEPRAAFESSSSIFPQF